MLEVRLDQLDEGGAIMAIDHSVVPRRGEVHDSPNDDVAVLYNGPVLRIVDAQNPHFGFVDDGCCTQSAKSTKTGDGEG